MMRYTGVKLLLAIDTAKSMGRYDLASWLWAVGLAFAEEIGFDVAVETQDPEGKWVSEAYYDLAVLIMGGKSANIPIPLLSPEAVATVYKMAVASRGFVERKVHSREVSEPTPEEVSRLYARVGNVLDRIMAKSVAGWGSVRSRVMRILSEKADDALGDIEDVLGNMVSAP